MKNQPSAAIENGFTAQLMKSVTPIPRQCSLTWPKAAKSILISIGTIINQIKAATGRLTLAISAAPIAWKTPGMRWPSAIPTTMQSATHRVSQRSKIVMVGSFSGCCCTFAAGVHNELAVFLVEFAVLCRRQDVEHDLGRPAKLDTKRAYDDRAIDQNRMLHHRVDELVIGQIGRPQAEFGIRCPFLAQH